MVRCVRKSRRKYKWLLVGVVALLTVIMNIRFEVVPIHFQLCQGKACGFRIMSYNVNSQAERFNSIAHSIADIIANEEPDFLFLTEYDRNTNDTIQKRLSIIYPYIEEKYRKGAFEGDVFYSKWQIDTIYRFFLQGHYTSIYRTQIHKNTDTLAVYCCHLSSNNLKLEEGRWASLQKGRKLRAEEADAIVEALQQEQYPVIVMGDMNDMSGSCAMRRLESAGLNDAWWKGGLGYGSTYSEDWLKLRIDHILYDKKKLKLQFVDVIGDYKYSDHLAVVAGLDFTN